MARPEDPSFLDWLLEHRHSTRAFLDTPVPRATLERILKTAQKAPSWCNIQPWRVRITAPHKTRELSQVLLETARSQLPEPDIGFPLVYPEPYQEHRRACGHALYGAMGIDRADKTRRYDAWLRNYAFFDAPHLLLVSRDKRLGEYATLDVGVWLGILLTAAQAHGVDCCAMASVAAYPGKLREVLGIPDEEMILFGIAFGYGDPKAPANGFRTSRAPIADNIELIGFDEP